MNFCFVYIISRWLESIENATETKTGKFVKKNCRELWSDVVKALLKYTFYSFPWKQFI